jgi:hypothetical protein
VEAWREKGRGSGISTALTLMEWVSEEGETALSTSQSGKERAIALLRIIFIKAQKSIFFYQRG